MANDKSPSEVEVLPPDDKRRYPTEPIAGNVKLSGHNQLRIWWTEQLARAERKRINAYKDLSDANNDLHVSLSEGRRVAHALRNIQTVLDEDQAKCEAAKRNAEVAKYRADTAAIDAEVEREIAKQRLERIKRGEDSELQKRTTERELARAESQIRRDQVVSDLEIAEMIARMKKIRSDGDSQKIHPDAKKFQIELQRQEDILAELRQRIHGLIESRGGADKLTDVDQDKIRQWEDIAQMIVRNS